MPYRISAALLLLMFALCRVAAAPLALASLWTHRALWGDAPLRRALLGGQLLIMVFFVVLNYFWFTQLVRRALRPAKAAKARDGEMAPSSARNAAKQE